ncbi:hypothetical protein [Gemella sanguinis]|uniref:hypothetical protein n=1 Tax=Gemella sanguinis TaxID=84135 RepID=UPI0028E2CE0E|nr:hypothetical protein [Gemella sanguinis]
MESDSYQEKNTKDKKKENSKVYDSIISKREKEKKVEFKIEKSNKGYYNIEVFPKLLKLEVPIYKQDAPLWAVMLKKDREESYFLDTLEIYIKIDNKPRVVNKDRGHLIPNLFKDYLLTENEIDQPQVKKFFEKGNKDNITPQSPESNRVHQLHFEQEVDNYLKGTKKSESGKEVDERKVYYEIEEISDINSNILGRRIYIHWFDDEKNNIHVFIPEEPINTSN